MRKTLTVIAVIATLMFTTSAMAQTRTLKGGHLYAMSKSTLQKAISMAVQKDTSALSQMVTAGLVGITKEGRLVVVTDTHIFSGIVKVRIVGSHIEIYIPIEALN
jgi:hypothetical protein